MNEQIVRNSWVTALFTLAAVHVIITWPGFNSFWLHHVFSCTRKAHACWLLLE